jgi:hypothetical protein
MVRPNVDTRDIDGVYVSPIERTNGCLMVEVFQGKWHDWAWYYPSGMTNQILRDGGVGPVERQDNKVWRWHPRNIYGPWDIDHVENVRVLWGYQGQTRYRKEGIIDPNAVLIRVADAPARDIPHNATIITITTSNPPVRPSIEQLTKRSSELPAAGAAGSRSP